MTRRHKKNKTKKKKKKTKKKRNAGSLKLTRQSRFDRLFRSPKSKKEINKEIMNRLKNKMKKSVKSRKKMKNIKEDVFDVPQYGTAYIAKFEGELHDGKTIYLDDENEKKVDFKKGDKIYTVYNKNEVNKHGFTKRSIRTDGDALPIKWNPKKGFVFYPYD